MTRRRDKKKIAQHKSDRPFNAILTDLSHIAARISAQPLPKWYVDKPFTCVECKSEEVWTAEQQKWCYEVAKGSLYATAKRCRKCRNQLKEQRRRSEAGRIAKTNQKLTHFQK